jgi:hypothetical protein
MSHHQSKKDRLVRRGIRSALKSAEVARQNVSRGTGTFLNDCFAENEVLDKLDRARFAIQKLITGLRSVLRSIPL